MTHPQTRHASIAFAIAAMLSLGALAGAAQAQNSAATPPPCETGDNHRAFDFWVGEWIVSVASGQDVGRNSIRKVAGGCALTEHWQSNGASNGTSLNYYDVAKAQWVQVWTGNGGSQIDIRGGIRDGSMVLEGYINYVGGDTSNTPFRGTWTPLDDGRVRQFFEQYSAEDEAWQPWFEGFYRRADKAQPETTE